MIIEIIALAPISHRVNRPISSPLCSRHWAVGVLEHEDKSDVGIAVSDVDVLVTFCSAAKSTFRLDDRFAFGFGGAVFWPAEVWGVGVLAFWDFVLDFF